MDLEENERLALLGMRALQTNGDGDEVFAGLNRDESWDFLALTRKYESGSVWSQGEEGRFADLRARHEAARQEIVQGKTGSRS